ncbi:unnamed protein product [Echinostoma caproni]|uniref:Alpha-1,3/1,6-mannosyltransferase ALG2 n=1 Tax=Echinostoma caproni TaxID=27848 RepID=A0A183AIP7_9TREM|nr:unnamed protein product [Echinostoma caproni]
MAERIVFLHPDLGIGGAERLIVDAAVAVNQSGYQVKIITNHHDPSHAFEETRKSELNVTPVASWFPRSVFGRCLALCAYVRLLLAAFYLIFTCDKKTDVVVVDQISAPLPLLHLTLFYCHFPDLLLTDRKSRLKKIYRLFIDFIEEHSTGWADKIAVNSQFTAGVFRQTFTSLKNVDLEVLYPVSNVSNLKLCRKALTKYVFVSINRYERKKNLQLILFSLTKPHEVHVVIAGGYDTRVLENVEYHEELVELARNLNVSARILIPNWPFALISSSPQVKNLLIASSDAVLYTPEGEHFGIVPVEAMFLSRPVIALDSGGPRETVSHGTTGFLCPTEPKVLLPVNYATQMSRCVLPITQNLFFCLLSNYDLNRYRSKPHVHRFTAFVGSSVGNVLVMSLTTSGGRASTQI